MAKTQAEQAKAYREGGQPFVRAAVASFLDPAKTDCCSNSELESVSMLPESNDLLPGDYGYEAGAHGND